MPAHAPRNRAYKDVTLQQLRSFCETVHLGSFTAAAASLGLAHPTVWKQVHALEDLFGRKLVEPHARGCRPTDAGRALAELADPLVTGIASLKHIFRAGTSSIQAHLVVAAAPRVMAEDLPECVYEFEGRHPYVRLTLKEVRAEEVVAVVEAGQADLGLTAGEFGLENPRLTFEPCYELDVILITPPGHPLARRRRVRARDLASYPLVNAPTAFPDPVIRSLLERHRAFKAQPRRVEATFATTIRRYVAMGFGIGLIGALPSRTPNPDFHERSMSPEFGRRTVYLTWKRGALLSEAARDFAATVKELLNRPTPPLPVSEEK